QEPKPSISYAPPPDASKPSEPGNRMAQIGLGGLGFLILLIVIASFLNHNRYYLKPVNGAVEVWQGNFAPKGASRLISLPGIELPDKTQQDYRRDDVFSLIYSYYRDKAATLLEVEGMPDFDAEKAYLEKALSYSTTPAEKASAQARINNIDLMALMSKADAAIDKNSTASLKAALGYLKEAAGLDLEDIQQELVAKKTTQARQMLDELEHRAAEAQKAANEAKLAEEKAKKAQAAKMKADKEAALKQKQNKTEEKEAATAEGH
ncbi:MAG: hypothetical protein LJE94_12515, partial [Deltaproteobacteria bacterium]|nr:hypothetical protein [Deltaproteobacteria bacterium]